MNESIEQIIGAITAPMTGRTLLHAASPLKLEPIAPPASTGLRIIVKGPITAADAKVLGSYAKDYNDVSLCISSFALGSARLHFLEELPFLKAFDLLDYEFTHFEDVRHLPRGLEAIRLSQTKKKTLSLSFLSNHPSVKRLSIESHTRDLDAVRTLAALEDLTIRSITLPNLDVFTSNKKLLSMDIKLGGTKNLNALAEFPALRYLELWMIKGFEDISVLAQLTQLQSIFLQSLKNVVRLPSCRALEKLRCVHLENMKGLTDLRPLAEAPNLERFHAASMGHLVPEEFLPFKGHPSLRSALIGLGSLKKNGAVEQLLGISNKLEPFEFRT